MHLHIIRKLSSPGKQHYECKALYYQKRYSPPNFSAFRKSGMKHGIFQIRHIGYQHQQRNYSMQGIATNK